MSEEPIKWKAAPDDKDYPAARSFLSLIYDPEHVGNLVHTLLVEPELGTFRVNDILRAAGLPPLGVDNAQVRKNLKKIEGDEPLSPVLLVRDPRQVRVIIADGYHRLSAVNLHDPCAEVPVHVASA